MPHTLTRGCVLALVPGKGDCFALLKKNPAATCLKLNSIDKDPRLMRDFRHKYLNDTPAVITDIVQHTILRRWENSCSSVMIGNR